MSDQTPSIPEKHADLLAREKQAFAALGLVLKDGTPQVTPMWFDYDAKEGLFIFNTARGRVKDRIMKRKPKVAFSVQDPANPYRYIQVRGRVVSESEEGAYDQICDLRMKYHGDRNYPKNAGEQRVTYKVQPERYTTMG
ncbi:MAG TPA: TIGR03618 family F420-dependent PPOX class oxidoreductase [Chloroflexota bacterium]|nr:TIGR03618 family F420-dependent PPOX class oxidoreductase [Chloroflexota bacterium]